MTVRPILEPAAPDDRPALSRRDLLVLAAAAASLQAVVWAVLLALFSTRALGYGLHDLSDTLLYHFYGYRFSMGEWPYSDVPMEYPPLAALAFLVGPVHGSVASYESWFSAAMIVVTAASAAVTTLAAAHLWRSTARALAVAAAWAALSVACGALAVNRYDALVALVVAVATLLIALRAWSPAAAALGIGFALKLTPALLLPLVLVVAATRRKALAALAWFAVAAAVPFVPFLLHDPGSVAYPFTYHSGRPLQIESVPGTPWLAASLAGGEDPAVAYTYGSQNIDTVTADRLAAASPWVMLLALAVVYALIWRRRTALRTTLGSVPVAALAVVLVAVCTSKVLSPQFLIWTFPLVALTFVTPLRLAKAAAGACFAAVVLTQIEFPARYWKLVAFEPAPVAIVIARNANLVLAAGLSIACLARLRTGEAVEAPALAPSPARSPAETSTARS